MTGENDFEDLFREEVLDPCPDGSGVTIADFRAYMPGHSYIFMPCCEIWPAASVNARLGPQPVLTAASTPKRKNGKGVTISASSWLDQNRPVEQMTWCPGLPKLVPDRLVVDGGWIERAGVTVFNLYRPPRIVPGDASKAGPWLDHVRKIYSDDANHIIAWLAHRVQRPHEKINHALVLGGAQGIGKDTLLEPLKHAVGPWNFKDVGPAHLMGRFNGFAKAIILRVSEARDLGDATERVNRFGFYEHCKQYIVTPPDVMRIDEKHLREYYIFNVIGMVITTNHKTDGIYLPEDDRRHYVAWSNLTKEDFTPAHFKTLYPWYYSGGFEHVAAYLHELDISEFDPKAPPPKTAAFWSIVSVNTAPEDAELADVLDALTNPAAVTLKQLIAAATGETAEWLLDRKNRRAVPHRLERCGYVAVRGPSDGQWKINGKRQTIYAKQALSPQAREEAAKKLAT
jgi:hypothetical protein